MRYGFLAFIVVSAMCLTRPAILAAAEQPTAKLGDFYRQRAATCAKEAGAHETEFANAGAKTKEALASYVKAKQAEAAVDEALATAYDAGAGDDTLLPLLKRLTETADASSRLFLTLGVRTNEDLRQTALPEVERAVKASKPELQAAADARVETRKKAISAWGHVADILAKPAITQAEFDNARLDAVDADNKMNLAERAYAIAAETLDLENLAKQAPSKKMTEKLAAYKKAAADLMEADKAARDGQLKLDRVACDVRQANKELRETAARREATP